MPLESDSSAAAVDARVAVVVPVFNKAPFVAATLRTVMAQTYSNLELVIVDDGSTDGSSEVVRQTLDGYPARMIGLTNGGVSRARNVGAGEVGDAAQYLLFLDADDLLAPEAIADLVARLELHPEAVACYSRLRYVDMDGRPIGEPLSDARWAWSPLGRRRIPDDSPLTSLDAIWARYLAIPSCCLIRRSAFSATDGWDSTLCPPAAIFGAEDKDMAIQLALRGEIHRLPQRLVEYRVMPNTRQDALYAGLKALDVKWWLARLDDGDRARVRRAIRFNFRVAALDAAVGFGHAVLHPTGGDVFTSASRLLRATLRSLLAGPLMSRWSRVDVGPGGRR